MVSDLSDDSSRSEQMAYLTNELKIDKVSAAMLYKAERLQDKGQLKQALKYYERVLMKYPGCDEAATNLEIVNELLEDQQKESENLRRLPTITEQPSPPVITEMHVEWVDRESIQLDYEPNADKAAFQAAKEKMISMGYSNSLLKLIKNEVSHKEISHDTGWEEEIGGRALFQVTLIRDENTQARTSLEEAIFQRLMANHRENDQMESEENIPNTGPPSISSNSQFVDPDENSKAPTTRFDDATEG